MGKLFSKTWSQTDYDRIRKLISMASESDAAEVEIETDGVRVLVRKHVSSNDRTETPVPVSVISELAPTGSSTTPGPDPPTVPEPSVEAQPTNGTPILSPTPGTFYTRPAPDADPFVQVGDHISEGQTVCIVEAMKLMNEIEAEITGTVLEILVSDGDAVEYDQPLMMIESA